MNPGQPYTQVYDPKTRSWSRGKDMITPRSGTGKAVFMDGEFYVMVCDGSPLPPQTRGHKIPSTAPSRLPCHHRRRYGDNHVR